MIHRFKLYNEETCEFDIHWQGLWDGQTLCGVCRESEDPAAGKFDPAEVTDEPVDCWECLEILKHCDAITLQRQMENQRGPQ